ncbi:MAG: LysM peptidoglycan-binding domain-containing protein [Prevotellaceae bacterium]|jgi:membrane-bound lytic murein transglycosylase D|nr:LysM peptidoglycan-binding domain-containing protein [Prevotellaceae bacterium]
MKPIYTTALLVFAMFSVSSAFAGKTKSNENDKVYKALTGSDDGIPEMPEDSRNDEVIAEESSAFEVIESGDEPLPATLSDSLYMARLKKMPSVINLPYNDRVRSYIILYTDKIRDKSQNILGLSEYYFPILESILDQYGLPLEFKYLPVIESALNPRAVSRVGATGLWQFMYGTAKIYGVTITSTVDDRRDPIASSHAAAKHLKDLYNIFDDWTLVIAAYNCGAGNVNKAIRRSGRKDFWGIYNYLPRETRGYVPAFIGVSYMMHYSKNHGLTPAKYSFKLLADFDTVQVNEWMHFDQIAELVGVPINTLRELNPQYRRDIIPGNEKSYTLKLPAKYLAAYLDNESKIAQYKASVYNPKTMAAPTAFTPYTPSGKTRITHHVRSGENIGGIANRYGVSAGSVRSWNGLRSNKIYAGQKLSIFLSPNKAQVYAKAQASTATASTTAASPQGQLFAKDGFMYYTVKPGDTLWSISQQYKYLGISDADIKELNSINNTRRLMPGQQIRIKKVG